MELIERVREMTVDPVVAVLTTVSPGGRPQATPLWYEFDGETFNCTAFTSRTKVRNIQRNPNVSLVVLDTVSPGVPLTIVGTASLSDQGASEITMRLAKRYLGEERGAETGGTLNEGGERAVIRITPETVLIGEHAERFDWS